MRMHGTAQALFDLEATNQELKADLRDLYITSAREIDVVGTTRKAIIVQVRAVLLGIGTAAALSRACMGMRAHGPCSGQAAAEVPWTADSGSMQSRVVQCDGSRDQQTQPQQHLGRLWICASDASSAWAAVMADILRAVTAAMVLAEAWGCRVCLWEGAVGAAQSALVAVSTWMGGGHA